jgi:hypothetical protein
MAVTKFKPLIKEVKCHGRLPFANDIEIPSLYHFHCPVPYRHIFVAIPVFFEWRLHL